MLKNGRKYYRKKHGDRALRWLNKNKMILNPDKFLAVILKKKDNHKHNMIKVSKTETNSGALTKLFGLGIDDKLKFFEHITKQHLNQNGTCFRA